QNSREDLFKLANNGVFVTEAMSPSFNPNNGDYSVGVSGFMIENGQITYPVSEITIAGNILTIYKSLIAANDLENKSALDCPSLLLEAMTIAGA
ncbi:MAG: TldD/PmbA family protein, partial [Caulobacterales bacterium]|nr:TldD/PmbA family protein [Caulobacterales bacterium]